ncbi:TIGR00282 family metallophosphoesterase [Tichowtungia aerotolerans]|uniref:TIGR00282 family metallophosphoesterase n=1 Tax=Tichowtungia aerotolerans TaxID=2697043 RepID=A0A6P1M0T8_9BACT|nr:TIGR00282 family metallophosphoesterase [Tichowtungia aerotolerans]QHI68170.1 TIGR00282 family metallophosphoesterase [Tichowtungia aerotolerans]
MKILFTGDMVGSAGRQVFQRVIEKLRAEGRVDLVIANAENGAGGRGPSPEIAEALLNAGAAALTLGDHTYDDRKLIPMLETESRIVRPANLPPGSAGRGMTTLETDEGPICLISLIGRVFLDPADCPFRIADKLLNLCSAKTIFVDFHAEATSEKIALGRYLDGRVTGVFGTHTHVQTSDETILPGGTAYITDLGMTGPKDSVIGRDVEPVIQKFITGMPQKFDVSKKDPALEGVIVDVDVATGKARSIERIRERA